MRFVYSLTLLFVVCSVMSLSQPKYRVFTQEQLAQTQVRTAGRGIASKVSFVLKNTYDQPMNVLSAHFSSPIISLDDSGGFPLVKLMNYRSTVVAKGKTLQPGDSVVLQATVQRIVAGTKITGFQMRMDSTLLLSGISKLKKPNLMPGAGVTTMTITHAAIVRSVRASSDQQVISQPSGGNVLDYLYRSDIRKPAGIVLGVPKALGKAGWIRTSRSDITQFPQSGPARCFDSVLVSTKLKPFSGELKNPSIRAYNNHLLGSLLALKLSIIANDSGVCEPYDHSVTPLRLLVYYDSTNPGDRFNNMTIRQICNLTDTALTYCSSYTHDDYAALDSCLSKIILDLSGELHVTSLRPMKITGVAALSDVPFLHANPAASPNVPLRRTDATLDTQPVQNGLLANYPNPFNPTTTISFTVKENSVVTLKVYNVLGQEVAGLLDRANYEQGEYSVDFNANSLPSGVYYYRIIVENQSTHAVFSDMKKMMMLK